MRSLWKLAMTTLAMLALYGALFSGQAFAKSKKAKAKEAVPATPTATPTSASPEAKAEAGTTTTATTPHAPPQAPVIGREIATTDQCFAKYGEKHCERESCLLTLESESQEVIQAVYVECVQHASAEKKDPPTP